MTKRRGAEKVLGRIDFFRGVGGLILMAAIGVAALAAGGPAGWILGVVLLSVCIALGVAHFRDQA